MTEQVTISKEFSKRLHDEAIKQDLSFENLIKERFIFSDVIPLLSYIDGKYYVSAKGIKTEISEDESKLIQDLNFAISIQPGSEKTISITDR